MKILQIQTIKGPNVYSHDPVLIMKLDLQDLSEVDVPPDPSNIVTEFDSDSICRFAFI